MKLITYLQTKYGISRRAITALIKEQKILLNDTPVEAFSTQLNSGDRITYDNKSSVFQWATERQQSTQYILFHKPLGYVVSKSDPHNPTIFELLPSGRAKSRYPIGRLDKESTWLLVLCNNPAKVNELLHPRNKHQKVYEVLVKQEWSEELTRLARWGCLVNEQGFIPEGNESADVLKFQKVYAKRTSEGPTLLTITLLEWKKRHIRRLLKFFWLTIITLHRVAFGPRELDDLKEGKWKTLEEEITFQLS